MTDESTHDEPQTSAGPEPVAARDLEVDGPSVLLDDASVEAVADADDVVLDADAYVEAPPTSPSRTAPQPTFVSSVTEEDREFLRRVFVQVKDVDFRHPPPPPERAVDGVERKMAFLRHRIRELERDLARIGFIWQAKQAEVDRVDAIIAEKDRERTAAIWRYEQVKEQATRSSASYRQQIDDLYRRLAEFEREVVDLAGSKQVLTEQVESLQVENQRLERERTTIFEEAKDKLAQAQEAFQKLRSQSTRTLAEQADLLTRKTGQVELLERQVAEQAERQNALQSELARLTTLHESHLQDLRRTIEEKNGLIGELKDEVRSARDEYAALAERLSDQGRVTVEAVVAKTSPTSESPPSDGA